MSVFRCRFDPCFPSNSHQNNNMMQKRAHRVSDKSMSWKTVCAIKQYVLFIKKQGKVCFGLLLFLNLFLWSLIFQINEFSYLDFENMRF